MGKYRLINKNIFFDFFLFLMVCAKGFGLDSSDSFYSLMAIIVIPFWMVHVLLISWNRNTFLYAMALFGVGFLASLITGQTGVMLSIMLMISLKDSDREKVMRTVFRLWLGCMAIMMLLISCGFIADKIVLENGKTWHGMGYVTGNVFHVSVVILLILYLYNRKDKMTYGEFFLLLFVNLIAYKYSASRSGLFVGGLAIFLNYAIRLTRKNRKANKIMEHALCIGMLLVAIFSFVFPLRYDCVWESNNPANVLNRFLTGRIQHGNTVLLSDRLTLFGNSDDLSAFVDNAYIFLLMKYGLIVTVFLCLLYILALRSMVRRGDDYGICLTFLFVLYGFTEQFFVNGFMNYSLLVIGDEIVNVILKKRKGTVEDRNIDKR